MSLLSLFNSTITASTTEAGPSFWMPLRGSSIAEQTDWVFYFVYWVSVFFFALIVGLMTLFIIKYHRRAGHQEEKTTTHHTALELTWTVIPLILVIVIFYLGLKGYTDLATPPAEAYEVNVTAKKWSWTFDHPNGASEAGELTLPLGRPVKLIMQSSDVLHSLFIPAFRTKQDVVPGRYTYMWFEPTREGVYDLFCAEYCGTDHSQMYAMVNVVPEEDFQRIIEQKARWIDEYEDDRLHEAGIKLYTRCESCHSLDGSDGIGPSFWATHNLWGKNRRLADGSDVVVDENYVLNSIINPNGQLVEGYAPAMPTFKGQLKPRELTALVEFIKRLDDVVDESGNVLIEQD
jgi:cytochrome c oxidase subunit 2